MTLLDCLGYDPDYVMEQLERLLKKGDLYLVEGQGTKSADIQGWPMEIKRVKGGIEIKPLFIGGARQIYMDAEKAKKLRLSIQGKITQRDAQGHVTAFDVTSIQVSV